MILYKTLFLLIAVSGLYGAPLGSVNFDGEIFCPSSVAELAANSESLQERAMRWGEKDAEKNSLDLTAGRINAHPFNYDLHLSRIPGENEKTLICFHGMGGNYQLGEVIKSYEFSDATLISFNFPDYGLMISGAFGSVREILPALYVLKKTVIDEGISDVSLYGFSAGGGAVVNVLAALNTSAYDSELKKLGIGPREKEKILDAVQKGIVILDVPLKSVEEIMDFIGSSQEMGFIAAQYKKNKMTPIDSLHHLKGLSLNVFLCFQYPDEILSNRDDELYIERLREANSLGTTTVIKGEGGHAFPHPALWQSINTLTR